MSSKKNDKKFEFHTTPFKTLKGVAVEGVRRSEIKPQLEKKISSSSEDEDIMFLRAMSDVKPVKVLKVQDQIKSIQVIKPVSTPKEALSDMDKDIFLDALRCMKLDKSFTDSIPGLHDKKRAASSNRLNLLKKGSIELNYELDLHGLTREDSLVALTAFIESARNHNQRAVLVITGKGINSNDGPVLRQAVTSWLVSEGRSSVIEFSPAPADLGGEGAIVVFLKKKQIR